MANFSQSLSSEGLRTTTITIPTSDVYNFQGRLTTTSKNDGSATQGAGGGAGTGTGAPPPIPSQVVTVVNQNGSPIFTSQAGARGFSLNAVVCVAGDIITFVTSSSLAQDQQSNSIRLILAISEGPL